MRTASIVITTIILVSLSPARDCRAAEIPEIIGIITSDTDHTLFGSEFVPMGDQNGDGFDDLLIWDLRPSVYLYLGGVTLDSLPILQVDSLQRTVSNAGDIDGDNIADFVSSGGNPSNWRLNTYLSGGGLDTTSDLFFGGGLIRPIGYAVNGNDINLNGSTELILSGWGRKDVLFYEYSQPIDSIFDFTISPANLELNQYHSFADRIIVGDFNGDDTTDLAVNLRFGNSDFAKVVFYWGGMQFDTIPDFELTRPGPWVNGADEFGQVLINLGDVNGDTSDDIYIQGGDEGDSLSFVFFTGSAFDTVPDIIITDNSIVAEAAGDVNNDGHTDLITGISAQSSGFGWAKVYFGGPTMDSLEDIHIGVTDIVGWHHLWGMQVGGVGDINGDNIDDFAVATVNGNDQGQVYIFAGTDLATAIEIIEDAPLPSEFELHQNYPNPFNPETTIEFSLSQNSDVELSIYNILGERVRTLHSNRESAGTYRVSWDGNNDSGNPMASGMYLYQLTVGEQEWTRKMILLK